MIYGSPVAEDALDQGDLVEDCLILSVKEFDPEGGDPPRINVARHRVLVLTQACDLATQKTGNVTVAVVHDAQSIVDQALIKPADLRGPVRAGRVYGWYFLPSSREFGLNEMIVDLRQLHTVRLDLLTALCRRGGRRARLLPPYREHLAKHFADTFSRIGLPQPYETES
jgi:hypothetical protein